MNNFLFILTPAQYYRILACIINYTGWPMSHKLYGLNQSDYGLQSKILFDT